MASSRLFSIFNRKATKGKFVPEFNYYLFSFVTWIPAVIFFNGNVGELCRINGPSMYPYLNTTYDEDLKKDLCWVSKWNPTRTLERGMLVSFQSPNNPERLAIKRVIAIEGDIVHTRAPCPLPTVQVPVNHVWVEGDNRDRSRDSNTYGPLPKSLIQGKLTYILWPWKSSGPIHWRQFKGKTRVIRGRRQDAPNWD
ncbi:LexA/Signal peptidase [Hyaloscypha bicolor E]|uniref:Mitochondrial inner membrane protease subunit 2 n=1 Tax=Hyaloscypha bicolor E TaxID=1095630 RepID=A0A2J6STZ6_9HELO|nr:LexA/Signal peptidase [Hyaloscypha bicolor E]PMD54229.1 LexA/Signal peptidase [Hyaloscypha bicolor E]